MSFRGLIALGLLAAACSPSVVPDAPDLTPGRPEARVPVYEGVLRHPAGADLGGRWWRVYVASSICSGAADAGDPGDCPDRLSASEQAELAGRLRDLHGDVRFVDADEARQLTRAIFGKSPGIPSRSAGPCCCGWGGSKGGVKARSPCPAAITAAGCVPAADLAPGLEGGEVGGDGTEGAESGSRDAARLK